MGISSFLCFVPEDSFGMESELEMDDKSLGYLLSGVKEDVFRKGMRHV